MVERTFKTYEGWSRRPQRGTVFISHRTQEALSMLPIGVQNEVEALACPIRNVVAKVTGKWQVLILLALEDGPLRFGEMRRTIGDVTQGVLTDNLRGLERDGLLTRTVHAGPPLAVSYQLTERGTGLVTMLKPLCLWAHENTLPIKAARAAYDEAKG